MRSKPRKFFVDENVSLQVAKNLSAVIPQHKFTHATSAHLTGIDDIELFVQLRYRDFDAIITQDLMQLERPDERSALRNNKLHWIGLAQIEIGGTAGIARQSATLMAGMSEILENLGPRPTVFRLKAPHFHPSHIELL